jgi:hypothetical protein
MRFLLVLLAGCTMLGDLQPVEGWPELKVTERRVPHAEMRDRCAPFVPAFHSPDACALFNLQAKTCDIYYSADFPPADFVVAHERRRCKGYGSATEREYLRGLMRH